jgi:hypothetical protein
MMLVDLMNEMGLDIVLGDFLLGATNHFLMSLEENSKDLN